MKQKQTFGRDFYFRLGLWLIEARIENITTKTLKPFVPYMVKSTPYIFAIAFILIILGVSHELFGTLPITMLAIAIVVSVIVTLKAREFFRKTFLKGGHPVFPY